MDQTKDCTRELIAKAHNNDKEAREKLVTDNLGLIWNIIKRFKGRGTEQEDLFQIGCIGLIKAIDNFNLDMDVAFSTYAVPMITGEIRRFLRDDGMVKVSRSIKENAVKSMRAAGQLRDTLGCEPTVEQIAAACELSVEDITLSMSASMEVESIYKTIYQGDGSEVMLMDKLEDKADIGETASSKVALAQLMETLFHRRVAVGNCIIHKRAIAHPFCAMALYFSLRFTVRCTRCPSSRNYPRGTWRGFAGR